MQQYRNNVQDQFGNVIANVTVTVNVRPGGGLATIFSDDGVTPKSNPFTNDSDSEFNFYADNGRYDIELTGPLTESIPDIRLLDLPGATASSFKVFTDIPTATPPTTEAVTGNFEIWDFDDDDQLASYGFNGTNRLAIRNYMHGGDIRLAAEDAAGAVKSLFIGDPDGTVEIYNPNDGAKRMSMLTNGRVEIFSNASTDAEDRFIIFAHADGTDRAQLGHRDANDVFTLRNMIHGGNVVLSGEDAGGTLHTMLVGNPDASTDLYYDGVKTFGQEAPGEAVIFGDANADIDFRVLYGAYADGTHKWAVGQENGSDLALRNEIHGGIVHLSAEDSGGLVRFFLQGDPDGVTDIRGDTNVEILVNVGSELALQAVANGAVTLYYNAISALQTRTNATGHLTMAQVKHADGNFYDIGLAKLPINTISAAEDIDNNNQQFYTRKSSGGAVTLELQSTSNIQTGVAWQIANVDTEDVTIDAVTNTCTLNFLDGLGAAPPTGNRTLAQAGICTIIKIGVSEYDIWGNAGLT